jgi:hypothetical protein
MLPGVPFPYQPGDSVQSLEPADSETQARRAYFTNYTRDEVVNHYKNQFNGLPTLRLNYPPEDSSTIIRDQTRTTYLEELVHPWRESVYINGFEPRVEKDDIWYKGNHYAQKITIKSVQSTLPSRLLMSVCVYLLVNLIMLEITQPHA